eukprot:EG_transcript_19862
MSNEIAAGDQHHNEWLNCDQSSSIPRKVPMGENLKIEWTATGRVSQEPLLFNLDDEHQLQVHWQEYRWVKELELLGQVFLNKRVLSTTERLCLQNDDGMRPWTLYRRDRQKSICVSKLVAALEDPHQWRLQVLHPMPTVFVLYFFEDEQYCSFAVDVKSYEAQMYVSECEDFPDEALNLYKKTLETEETALQKAVAVAHTMAKKGPAGAAAAAEEDDTARWDNTGRIPPFTSSGLPRVDRANKYIKAPFHDNSGTPNPMLTMKRGVEA